MYKLCPLNLRNEHDQVKRLTDFANIPFNPANADYAQFKKDINEGAELQDADSNTMTAEQAKDFVKELP